MKVKEYPVLCEAIERGVKYGYNKAYKHTNTPSENEIKDHIFNAVLDEICEWFEFDELQN